MRDKHIFSKTYTERKEAVLHALRREEALKAEDKKCFYTRTPIKIVASVAILSVLTVSVYAAVQWIDFRMEQNGDEVRIHASLNETGENDTTEEKPVRSWNAEEGEISIRLNIPDLPSDMRERENTNGKYYSEDSSRSMTINGIDLRRSDLDQIIGGGDEAKQIDVGGKTMFVIGSSSDAAYYNRTAFILFEKEELVLKLWVSYGITDDELTALASTMTVEETTDVLLALPIINEVLDDSYDWTTPITVERDPIYETDLIEIGESKRAATDWYTITVNKTEFFDNINVLNPGCILRKDFVNKFVDDAGNLIPYNRTEKLVIRGGNNWSLQFGDTVLSQKKLLVVTMTMAELDFESFDEEDREGMLQACVNEYDIYSYTVTDGKIDFNSPPDTVVDRRPESRADSSEIIYREYLGNNQWKVAYLIEEDIAEGNLVLYAYTGKVTVKIK
ncbi:MAG: hypothetical protein IKI93_20315 [Clostridia bacterium]|nr:hypothetical protein [Clostridia bacterium]